MLDVLKKQLLNAVSIPDWAINTGALRQIGKTTTLLNLAEEFIKNNNSPMVSIGVCPRVVVYVIVANQTQKKRLEGLRKDLSCIICTDSEIEGRIYTHSGVKVVLFDEGCNLENLYRVRKDHHHKFAFFAGWMNEQQVTQYQQLNAKPY